MYIIPGNAKKQEPFCINFKEKIFDIEPNAQRRSDVGDENSDIMLNSNIMLYSKHKSCEYDACDESCESGKERSGQSVTCLCNLCRQKIHAHSIKNRLGAGHTDRGDKSDKGVGSVFFVNIRKKPRCRRGGKHLYNGERDKFSRESDVFCKVSDELREKIKKAGGAQDTDGNHKPDECRHDFDYREKSFFSAFDKGVIYIYVHQTAVADNPENNHGDDKIRYV